MEQIRDFEAGLYQFVENAHPGVLQQIREKIVLDDGLKGQLNTLLKEYKQRFASEKK